MKRLFILALAGLCVAAVLPVDAAKGQPKSPRKAFLLSLILPGAGQYYVGASRSASYFLGAEAASWIGFIGFRRLAGVRQTHYKTFSAAHAGIDPEGKPRQFFIDMGDSTSLYQYNRRARYIRGLQARLYPEEAGWTWEWDSKEAMARYRELFKSSDSAERRALYMVGLAVTNRIVSAIHAARVAESPEEERTTRVQTWSDGDVYLGVRVDKRF